jgi:hypothetical protein
MAPVILAFEEFPLTTTLASDTLCNNAIIKRTRPKNFRFANLSIAGSRIMSRRR